MFGKSNVIGSGTQTAARNPKLIFGPYRNGETETSAVYGDPAELHDRLIYALDGNPDKVLAETKSDHAETKFNALEKWLKAIVFAFDLKAFDKTTGKGLQRGDIIALGNSFAEYLKKKETPPAGSPTGLEPTTSFPTPSNTRRSSDCGCT